MERQHTHSWRICSPGGDQGQGSFQSIHKDFQLGLRFETPPPLPPAPPLALRLVSTGNGCLVLACVRGVTQRAPSALAIYSPAKQEPCTSPSLLSKLPPPRGILPDKGQRHIKAELPPRTSPSHPARRITAVGLVKALIFAGEKHRVYGTPEARPVPWRRWGFPRALRERSGDG